MRLHAAPRRGLHSALRLWLMAIALTVLWTGCAASRLQLPDTPGPLAASDEASFVYFEAGRLPCSFESITAVASIRGSIGRHHINGTFKLATGRNRLRLESAGNGPKDYILTADESGEAFVYRESYLVRGAGRDAIELILGLPLKADELRPVLTGCPVIVGGGMSGRRFNDRWFLLRIDGDPAYDVYAERDRDGLGWTARAIDTHLQNSSTGWRAEFEREATGQPKAVRISSREWNSRPGERFDVRVTFTNVRVNERLAPETFRAQNPDAVMAVEAIRESRPASAPYLVDPQVR